MCRRMVVEDALIHSLDMIERILGRLNQRDPPRGPPYRGNWVFGVSGKNMKIGRLKKGVSAMKRQFFVFGVGVLFLTVFAAVMPCPAQETEQKPEREIVAAFEYPGKVIDESGSISLDLIIKNNGRKDETVRLSIEKKPDNFKAKIEKYGDVITGLFVPSGEQKTLTFSAKETDADNKLTPGEYHFEVSTATADGKLTQTASADITVKTEEKTEEGQAKKPVKITTSYPNLRGSSDSDFEFSIDIHNETDEEDMFVLRSEQPQGWDVSFKPSYENKYIGSLKIKGDLSQSVDVKVKPPPKADIGENVIKVFAKSSKGEAEIELKVILTGKHDIACRTPQGLLSLTARKGQEANMSMYVINEGSAPQPEVSFTSFKPENWEVKFEPEKVEALEPGDMKQVEVTIKPAAEALVGDYSVAVNAQGEDASDDIEFRVTVKAATTWGWIGVGIIVVVVVGLAVTFKLLGRR